MEMKTFSLVIRERGSDRGLRSFVSRSEVPAVDDMVELCSRLPFGKQKVTGIEADLHGDPMVLFEEMEPHVFEKFRDYLEDDPQWELLP